MIIKKGKKSSSDSFFFEEFSNEEEYEEIKSNIIEKILATSKTILFVFIPFVLLLLICSHFLYKYLTYQIERIKHTEAHKQEHKLN